MSESVSLELHRAVVAQHSSAFDVLREAHVILDGIIGPDGRKIAARLQDVAADRATNAALAERVQALEAALDAKTDEAATLRAEIAEQYLAEARMAPFRPEVGAEQMARAFNDAALWKSRAQLAESQAATLRAALERVEWQRDVSGDYGYYSCPWCEAREDDGHRPDCPRQAALAQTAQEVKHGA